MTFINYEKDYTKLYEMRDPGIRLDNLDKAIQEEIEFFKTLIRPLNFKYVVRVYTEADRTESGFCIPPKDFDTSCVGIVVSISDRLIREYQEKNMSLPANLGDLVMFPRHEGLKVKLYDRPVFYIDDDRLVSLYFGDIRKVSR